MYAVIDEEPMQVPRVAESLRADVALNFVCGMRQLNRSRRFISAEDRALEKRNKHGATSRHLCCRSVVLVLQLSLHARDKKKKRLAAKISRLFVLVETCNAP